MKYENIVEATFLERPNRFVARVRTEVDGETAAHVPNTGRCKEIFVPDTKVYLNRSNQTKRKYPYTLVSAYKGKELIHIHSAGANTIAEEALKEGRIKELQGATDIEREKTFLNSRFDFRFTLGEKTCYMEVKGVTLEVDGRAKFPDAPTERGVRHLEELIKAKEAGFAAYVLFVIQMKGVSSFAPNEERDPAFAAALKKAKKAGVGVLAYDCWVRPQEILLDAPIPIILEEEK